MIGCWKIEKVPKCCKNFAFIFFVILQFSWSYNYNLVLLLACSLDNYAEAVEVAKLFFAFGFCNKFVVHLQNCKLVLLIFVHVSMVYVSVVYVLFGLGF